MTARVWNVPAVFLTPSGRAVRACGMEGGLLTLEDMQRAVGGNVEALDVDIAGHECTLWFHEEGKLIGLPPNSLATQLVGTRLLIGDYIAGDVLVTGGCGPEGETLPIHPGAEAALLGT